jgi:hypothetical protein
MTTVKPEIKYLEPTLAIEMETEPKDMGGLITLAEGKEQALPLLGIAVGR